MWYRPLEMSHDAEELVPGTVLADRYEIEASIGRGGAGVVYRARQLGLDRIVAVKVLHENVAFSARELERFRREAVTTGRLRHPNIVTVHDFGTLPDGRSYLVLEYLSGPSLDKWIVERGAVAPDLAAEIVKAVCSAVQASHAQGVIHRDLKPSNVILPPDGGDAALLKVVDFGVARLREGDSSLTGGLVIGTPAYVAPEVIEGDAAGVPADVYSIGLIAYELLTGRRPFTGQTSYSFLYQHLSKDPPAPSSLAPGLSVALDAVVLRALAKDPAKRYETPLEFGDAFEIVAREAARRRGSGARPTPVTAAPAEKPVVLVVEDDEVLSRLVKAILKNSGYDSAVASDGIDALMLLGSRKFDLVISDVDMPNLDGFQLLEMMAAKGIDTPVIFLTSYEEPEREVRGLELGAADFIRKPISPAVLAARIKRVLAR